MTNHHSDFQSHDSHYDPDQIYKHCYTIKDICDDLQLEISEDPVINKDAKHSNLLLIVSRTISVVILMIFYVIGYICRFCSYIFCIGGLIGLASLIRLYFASSSLSDMFQNETFKSNLILALTPFLFALAASVCFEIQRIIKKRNLIQRPQNRE